MSIDTRPTYLIQRLKRPYERTEHGDFMQKAARVFGEGMGLGLSDKARELLRDVCRFDYMGAAEFEFGAIPRTLGSMASSKLSAMVFTLEKKDISPGKWREYRHWVLRQTEIKKAKAEGKKPPRAKKMVVPDAKDTPFYILCPEGLEEYVKEVIVKCAKNEQCLKEYSGVSDVLDPEPDGRFADNLCGWLEINHGFLFFTDREMFDKFCVIYGVEVPL